MKIEKPWLSKEEFAKIQGSNWVPSPHTHVKVDITDLPWNWVDVSKTGSNLTDLATRQHAGLTDISSDQHHAQSHSLASHSTKPHSALTDILPNQHHNKLHSMTGVAHSASGLTVGWVIRATAADAFAWGAIQEGDLPTHNIISKHSASGLTIGHVLKATGASAFAFQANNLAGLSDVTLGSLEEGETLAYDQSEEKWVDAWGVEYDNPRLVWKMYTDFFSAGVDSNDPWVGATLIGGIRVSTPAISKHPGVLYFETGTVINSGYRFMTATNCLLIAGEEHTEFVFKTFYNTITTIRLGFQDSLTSTAPTDGIWINIANATLTGKTRSNGTESTTGTSYPLSNTTWYRAKFAVSDDATLVTFILYSEAGTQLWSQTLATNIPSGANRQVGHGVVAYASASPPEGIPFGLIWLDMMIATRAGAEFR